jgi:hypothetical protein
VHCIENSNSSTFIQVRSQAHLTVFTICYLLFRPNSKCASLSRERIEESIPCQLFGSSTMAPFVLCRNSAQRCDQSSLGQDDKMRLSALRSESLANAIPAMSWSLRYRDGLSRAARRAGATK